MRVAPSAGTFCAPIANDADAAPTVAAPHLSTDRDVHRAQQTALPPPSSPPVRGVRPPSQDVDRLLLRRLRRDIPPLRRLRNDRCCDRRRRRRVPRRVLRCSRILGFEDDASRATSGPRSPHPRGRGVATLGYRRCSLFCAGFFHAAPASPAASSRRGATASVTTPARGPTTSTPECLQHVLTRNSGRELSYWLSGRPEILHCGFVDQNARIS